MDTFVENSALPRSVASTWKAMLPAANIPTGTRTMRLRQLRPATISRATTANITSRKALSSNPANRGVGERRTSDRNASRDPHANENDERPALKRQPSSPVWNSVKRKAGYDGGKGTKQHFMDVPIARLNAVGTSRSPR